MSIRGGGQRRFAETSGISSPVLGRILRGESRPDIDTLLKLSETLGEPLADLLIRAGVATPEQVYGAGTRTDRPPITPEEAADELGLTDPYRRALYLAQVETLRRLPPGAEERAEH